jgi:diguanylate cyclase (GGDEF)-like protein/PAS domain S-box-containing protein
MSDECRTTEQLTQEIASLNQRVLDLEKLKTESKKKVEPPCTSEEQHRDKEYRTFFECLPIGIIVCDKVGNIVESNKEAESLLGLSQEMQSQRRIDRLELKLIHTDGSPMQVNEYAGVRAMKENRVIENVEVGITNGESATKWTNVIAAPIPHPDYGVIIAYTDVTKRKQVQESLRESKERYQKLFEDSPIALLEADFSDIKKHVDSVRVLGVNDLRKYFQQNPVEVAQCITMVKILNVNKAALALYKADRKEDIFNGLGIIFGTESYDVFREGIIALIEDRNAYESEFLTHTLKCDRKYVNLRCSVVAGHEDSLSKVLMCVIDNSEYKTTQDALKHSEEKYRTLFESASEGILIASIETSTFLYANPAICKMLGYSEEELTKLGVKDIHPRGELYHVIREFEALIRGEKTSSSLVPCLKKDGTVIYVDINSALSTIDGENCNIGFFTDATKRAQVEKELQENRDLLNEMGKIAKVAGWEFDVEKRVQTWTQEINNFHDLTLDPHLASVVKGLNSDALGVNPVISEAVEKAIQFGDSFDLELPLITNKGNKCWVHAVGRAYLENGKTIKVKGIFQDITERKQLQQKLEIMASHDNLTGLPNRSLLLDRFNVATALARRNKSTLAVMSLDLDKFKAINDTLGHEAGDQVLKVVSARLLGMIRTSDTIARMGGDEFVLLIMETKRKEDTIAFAQKTMDSFMEPVSIDGHQVHLSASIGIANYPQDAEDLVSLTKKSDTAMYYSKCHGRNQFNFFSDCNFLIREDHKRADLS